jgi:hypothetical protein
MAVDRRPMARSRLATLCSEAEAAAGALHRWSLRHVLASINPLAKLRTVVAFAVAMVWLATGAWALIYRALAFMSVDRRFGVFGATEHPRAVVRSVFLLFAAAVAVNCFFDGRSVPNIACILAVSALGAHRAQRMRAAVMDQPRPAAQVPPAVTSRPRRGST